MNDAALPYLRCPVCEDTLEKKGSALRCVRGHSFDIAKQGYVNLTRGRTRFTGDSPEMVEARARFLEAGHYRFLADALISAVPRTDGLVLDAGTGTGWYLAQVLDAHPEANGLGLDVSKPALRRAARAHPRAGAVLADLWEPLPVADVAVILNVFAPRNGPEYRRVLRPGGILVVATPAADHLAELRDEYGLIRIAEDKDKRVSESLSDFVTVSRTTNRSVLRLTGDELRTLIGMTPSARHLDVAALRTDGAEVTAAVDVTVYR